MKNYGKTVTTKANVWSSDLRGDNEWDSNDGSEDDIDMAQINEIKNAVVKQKYQTSVVEGVYEVVDITSFYDRQRSWLIFRPENERERERASGNENSEEKVTQADAAQ